MIWPVEMIAMNERKGDAMNTLSTVQVSPEALLQRIDAIMRELQELRRLIVVEPPPRAEPHEPGLVAQLAGCLGQGSWDEYEDDIEWERFAS
jgi:hypothetical protein